MVYNKREENDTCETHHKCRDPSPSRRAGSEHRGTGFQVLDIMLQNRKGCMDHLAHGTRWNTEDSRQEERQHGKYAEARIRDP